MSETSTTFLVHNRHSGRYVERRPFDGAWTWLATRVSHATVFPTAKEAFDVAALMNAKRPDCAIVVEINVDGAVKFKRAP